MPNILLIDHDTVALEALSETLALRVPRARVDTAKTVSTALSLITIREYDLIVCDFQLPGMEWPTLLKRSKAIRPGVPVVMITSYQDLDLECRALRLGASIVMQKPIEREVFLGHIERMLHESRSGPRLKQTLDRRPSPFKMETTMRQR